MYSRARLAAGVGIGILLFTLFFSVPRTSDSIDDAVSTQVSPEAPKVTVQDVYKKGVHTLTGSLEADNACASVSSEAFHERGDERESHIRVAITLVHHEGTCLQLPTRMRFTTSLTAPAKLPIVATVNGSPAILE